MAAGVLAQRLGCAPAPTHTTNVLNGLGGLDVVYALAAPPMSAPPPAADHTSALWLPPESIPPSYGSYAITQCLQRIAQRAVEGPPPDVVLSAVGPPVPWVRSTEAAAWSAAPTAPDAKEQWHSFLQQDHAHCVSLQRAMQRADSGDGRLRRWAEQVQSALDVSAELPSPSRAR